MQDEVLLDSCNVGKSNTAAGVSKSIKNHAHGMNKRSLVDSCMVLVVSWWVPGGF